MGMNVDNLEKELYRLHAERQEHDRLYYKDGKPNISDYHYDQLVRQIRALEKETGIALDDDIGDDRKRGFRKVEHTTPMRSIPNVYTNNELEYNLTKIEHAVGALDYVVEPKVDGIAISLTYERGLLIRAVTRGNGFEGDDVTANVRTIKNLPARLEWLDPLELRGELYIDQQGFVEYNQTLQQHGLQPFLHARNMCAGTVKLLNPDEVAKRPLGFIGYTVVSHTPDTHIQELDFIKALGFNTLEPLFTGTLPEVLESIASYAAIPLDGRSDQAFATDGVVIRVNARKYIPILGFTRKYERWMFAYKFAPEQSDTHVLDVEFNIGRTGVLTPVAILEPTLLSGSTVSRANLHNFNDIRNMGGLMIGDVVTVVKAGEIIPDVVAIKHELRTGTEIPIRIPENCPYCGSVLHHGTKSYCNNPKCQSRILAGLLYFASKECMDIQGLGFAALQVLAEQDLVTNCADMYRLTAEMLEDSGKFAGKTIANILEAIEMSKEADVTRVLQGLGIRGVGASAAEKLINTFSNIPAIMRATVEELQQVPDIGPVTAKYIYQWCHAPDNVELVQSLAEVGLHMDRAATPEEQVNVERSCVITGTLPQMTREQIESVLKSRGVKVEKRVTANTEFVLAGDSSGATKLTEARRRGIPVHDLAGYLQNI
jgi:DNA ligase (NAD+)